MNGIHAMHFVAFFISLTSSAMDKKIFFSRVRSQIINKFIRSHFSDATIHNLELHCSKFEWTDSLGNMMEDEATMLKLLFDEIKPTVKTGVKEFRTIITTATASKYKENVADMLNDMQQACMEITIKQKKTFDQFEDKLFWAL